MTYDHGYGEDKVCETERESSNCKLKHPEPQNILLECGQGTGRKTFTSVNDTPFQLAHVTVDITGLNRAQVLIKFSSLVKVERLGDGATVRLKYELSRGCEDEDPISLGTWIFEKVNINTGDFDRVAEESFNLIFCECLTCPACYDYFVTVRPLEINNGTGTVSNGRMASLTQPLHDCSKNECKPKIAKSKETILTCGSGNGSVIFRSENESPVVIGNVTIDTSSLCDPKILIEFSTIVSYFEAPFPNSTIHFKFELFRRCSNEEPICVGVWTYEVGLILGNILLSQGFGFTFCECVNFSSCYKYFVRLTPVEVPAGGFDSAMISNSRMTAIAQSSKDSRKTCETKSSKPKKVLLECGQGNGSRTIASANDAPFQLAHVTVDTCSLCNPTVNIECSSILTFDTLGFAPVARLRYELFRVWDNGMAESVGVWDITRVDQNTSKVTESFDFTFCEPIECKARCCTYFVKVTPIEIFNSQVTVSNGRMAVLVQEG